MEANDEGSSASSDTSSTKNDFLEISSNWQISGSARYHDAVSTTTLLEAPKRTNLQDVVSLDTCILLRCEPSKYEPCVLDVKLTNRQRIARIAVASEAYVLEFFKDFGEYSNTVFAELIDEFEGHSVYLAEAKIEPPSTEASIKFAKKKNMEPQMWVYGIRLILTEPLEKSETNSFNNIVKNFLNSPNDSLHKNFGIAKKVLETLSTYETHNATDKESFCKGLMPLVLNPVNHVQSQTGNDLDNKRKEDASCAKATSDLEVRDIKTYIDNKFHDMETRLMQRMNEIEYKTNEKLDAILKNLETTLKSS